MKIFVFLKTNQLKHHQIYCINFLNFFIPRFLKMKNINHNSTLMDPFKKPQGNKSFLIGNEQAEKQIKDKKHATFPIKFQLISE
jgi:hypothetical protein